MKKLLVILVSLLVSNSSFMSTYPESYKKSRLERIIKEKDENTRIDKLIVSYDTTRVKFDFEFKKALVELTDSLDIKIEYLMTVMHVETIGTFSPTARSPIGAVGLIQFTRSTARWLGTSTHKLGTMTSTNQLAYVEKYLRLVINSRGKLKSLEDVFVAVHYPVAVGRSFNYVLYRKGSAAYSANRFNDRNNDGKVTKREISNSIRKIYYKYYS